MENPRAWVEATIWRLLANQRRAPHASPLPSEEDWKPAADPEPRTRLEIRAGMASAARWLPGPERRLLGLLVWGYSHREIAERLGIGWRSVGIRIQRLRAKLRLLLDIPSRRR